MSKKVVLFTTYLLEVQTDYLFDKHRKRFSLDFFKSSAMLDYLLTNPKTLKACNTYFAMMDWKNRLVNDHLWQEEFESSFLRDEINKIDDYYKDDEVVYRQLCDSVDTHLEPVLNLSAGQIDKELIKQRIIDIRDDVAKQECQRFASDVLNMYWGKKPAPELPLLHRRFSLYVLNNEDDTDYATYAVWCLGECENNDVNKWPAVLINEILNRNPECKEIILAIHDRDLGRVVPFQLLKYKYNYNYKDFNLSYSVVLFDHTNSRIHSLLRERRSCKKVYDRISELLKL